MNRQLRFACLLVTLSLFGSSFTACTDDSGDSVEDPGIEGSYFDEDYGKPLFDNAPQPGKADSIGGRSGLPASVDNTDTVVWEIRNQWHETDTEEARQAGMAWPENSGLTWDEKYAAWVDSMERIDGDNTYYETFQLTTPWGKSLPAPNLECAETSIFLRAAFASWYGLPFYLEAGGPEGRVYFGHFGARTANGRYKRTPRYKRLYDDYTDQWSPGDDWPSDSRLKGREMWGTASDAQPFLGPDAHLGAYVDEIFLNKRTGYFVMLLLSYFGSVNLADANNTFNLVPEAIRPGDTLLERWQRRGIGHTLVLKEVRDLPGGQLEAELVSGSMPRRQPKWEDAASSKRSFTLEETGGEGENSDGERYAALGGGIKRWRTARVVDGVYRNVVPSAYRGFWIPNYSLDKIAARPGQFEALLGQVSPEALRDVVVQQIDDARNHLRQYPASCSARIRREDAFRELYNLNQERFGLTREETDAQYRELEDYVFAELQYEVSKTCCWNSSTSAMYQIAMQYNEERVYDEATGTCNPVTVFKNTNGGYQVFSDYAASLGRGSEWVAWSEDEPCSQRNVENDTEAEHEWTPLCDIHESVLDLGGSPTGCADDFDGNDSRSTAAPVEAGSWSGLNVCENVDDWYEVGLSGGQTLSVEISFTHAEGDLDLELVSAEGNVLGSSTSVEDAESASVELPTDGQLFVHVYGYSGAANEYDMTISVQ